jgi:hypothetical protein
VLRKYTGTFAVALLCAALTAGCTFPAWLAAVTTPPETVKARYVVPSGSTALVLVKGADRLIDYPKVESRLVHTINEQLINNDVADFVIDRKEWVTRRLSNPNFDRMSEIQLGRQLKADVVICVIVDRFTLRDRAHAPMWHGVFITRVKLISIEEKRQLWPPYNDQGEEIRAEVEPPHGSSVDRKFGSAFALLVADDMADRIAKLFYDHPGRDPTELPEQKY